MSIIIPFPAPKPEPRELDLAALADRVAHEAALNMPTSNTCGIRVGDLFYVSFGYNMTINHFYQVVGMKAKATVTLRRIAAEKVTGGGFAGDERPVRGHFVGEPEEKRSRVACGRVCIPAPGLTDHHMYPTTDDKLHYYNTMD